MYWPDSSSASGIVAPDVKSTNGPNSAEQNRLVLEQGSHNVEPVFEAPKLLVGKTTEIPASAKREEYSIDVRGIKGRAIARCVAEALELEILSRPKDSSVAFPSYEDLMDPANKNVDMDTFFSSYEEASRALAKCPNMPADRTMPTTIQQKKAIVKALFNAITSTERAQDNPGMIKPFLEKKYPDVQTEVVCWKVLVCLSQRTSYRH